MLKRLGDNLVLRSATTDDTERVADFNATVFLDDDNVIPRVRELMSGEHPGVAAADFTLVEDERTGAVVSSLCIMSRRWSYGEVPFDVDEVAIVGTNPDYRGRGLVRSQVEVVHGWSTDRGHLVQGLLGIPWFYRQFGYEPALEDAVRRVGGVADVPELGHREAEPWLVRPAVENDIPFVVETQVCAAARHVISAVLEADRLRYALTGRMPGGRHVAIVESPEGKRSGFLSHRNLLFRDALELSAFELAPHASWRSVTSSVLRYLRNTGSKYASRGGAEFSKIALLLGTEHPMYDATNWPTRTPRPHAWYIRVPDVVAFIRRVAPAFDRRLQDSPFADHSGAIKVSLGDVGMRITLAAGRVASAEPWGPTRANRWANQRQYDAIFPGLVFLQLLFGFRSTTDLEYAFPDCRAGVDETRALLDSLFPKGPSNTWAAEYPW